MWGAVGLRNARNLAKKISQSQCTSAVTEQPAGWPGSFTIAVMNVLIADAVVAGAADLGGDRCEALGGDGDRGGGAGGGLPHGVFGLDLLMDPSRDSSSWEITTFVSNLQDNHVTNNRGVCETASCVQRPRRPWRKGPTF